MRQSWSVGLAVVLACAGGVTAAIEDGLVGSWSFAGSDGRTVADTIGGRTGTIEAGEVGRDGDRAVLQLDGVGDGVVITLAEPLPITKALTALLWVKPTVLRDNTVLFGIPHSTPSWTTPVIGVYLADGRPVSGLWLGDGPSKVLVEAPSALPTRAWTCVVVTYDGQTSRLYLDGRLAGEQPAAGNVAFNGQPLLLGRGLGNKPSLRGALGELRLWNRAMPAAEVQSLFEQTRAGYDLSRPTAPASAKDGTVMVESHGSSPASSAPWRQQPTRLLKLLDGYRAADQPVPVDAYGGRTDRPAQQATGFFRTVQLGERQWLIDPEGRPFYHLAVNQVREPPEVEANYGSADRWAATVVDQLRAAGFNGLGNGQSERLRNVARPLVWVRRRDFMFAFARAKQLTEPAAGTQGFTDHIMPVFHPDFEPFCAEYAKDLATTVDDPYLLGIMTDNELQCPVDLLDRCLAIDPAHPDLKYNRQAAEAWLTERRAGRMAGELTNRDRYQFIAYLFERYYQIVTAAIRRVDARHLYLGSRINYRAGELDNPWFWRMLTRYHDVVSLNYYHQWGPDAQQFADWASWCGKPILLTEWYAKAMDGPGLANTKGAGWLVHTQEDRARFYQHFALGALETPNIVGWHWFKYRDDPSTSTALDAAGGANKGMFDYHGRPYETLVQAAAEVNREAYGLIDYFDSR